MADLHITVAAAPASMNVLKDIIVPIVVPITATIVGAAVAYFPSRYLAKRASAETLQRDQQARHDASVRAARQVFVKLSAIANAIGSYHRQFEGMIAKAESDGNGHMPIYQRLSTFAGVELEKPIAFDAQELEIFVAGKQIAYIDKLMLLSRRYTAMLSNLASFAAMRQDLHYESAKAGSTTRDANGVSTTAILATDSFANYLRVKAGELELFAVALREQLQEDAIFAGSVAKEYQAATHACIGDGAVLGLSEPTASPR